MPTKKKAKKKAEKEDDDQQDEPTKEETENEDDDNEDKPPKDKVTKEPVEKEEEKDHINELKVYKDTESLKRELKKFNLRHIYTYKPLRSDDQILVVRCKAVFNRYATFLHPQKIEWSVLTQKQYYSNDPTTRLKNFPKDPLAIGYDGQRLHDSVYSDISKGVLCGIIGCEMIYLFELAAVLHAQKERERPYTLSDAPKFKFAGDFATTNEKWQVSEKQLKKCKSKVELEGPRKRFYDDRDLDKNGKNVMPLTEVGDFLFPQCYYFDMRQFTTHYFVNVQSQQISGLYYDEAKDTFFGLVKHGSRMEHLTLEIDWLEENFDEEFLELVKKKSKRDRRKYIKLPIGKAKPLSSPQCNVRNPKMKYLQNGKDNCVFASMASALYYMNYTNLANLIWMFSEEFAKTQYSNDTYGQVLSTANLRIGKFKDVAFNKKYQLIRIRSPDKFDLIETAKMNPNILYHVVLKGSDGSENHCVCVYNNFIFDGNYTHAWKLEQRSLDECIDSTFKHIVDGYMHVPSI